MPSPSPKATQTLKSGFAVLTPVATAKAAELNLKVIAADGKNLENLQKIFNDEDFTGTIIPQQIYALQPRNV